MWKIIKNFRAWVIGLFATACLASGGAVADMQINPYDKIGELYKMQIAGEQVQIGGADETILKPELKLNKWGDETFVKVGCENWNLKAKGRALMSNKIKWENQDRTIQLYPDEENKFEFEIILKKKPVSNIIELKFESQGLDFDYQPPLNLEFSSTTCTATDCAGRHRPEHIVGSYAVYHVSAQGDYSEMGGKNYKAGKAFHIYRPRIIDNNGNGVWGELNIDVENNLLTVEIPPLFLKIAQYPVRHAAGLTFGYTTIGGSDDSGTNRIRATPSSQIANPSQSGTADSITAYLYRGAADDGKTWTGALYNNSASFLEATEAVSFPSPAAWVTANFSSGPAITADNNYYVASNRSAGAGTICKRYYDVTGTNYYHDYAYSSGWPATLSVATTTTRRFSQYVTYTAGGGPSDTCTYSSGDWNVLESDNCYITADVYVHGDFNLIGSSTGQFGCADGVKVSAEKFNFGTDDTTFEVDCFAHH